MWEWFVANRIWIFIAAIIGFILAYFLRNRAAHATARVMPTKVWRERMQLAEPLVSWILFGIAGGILGTALAAVIVSYYQIDIKPAMGATGGWLLDHGIPILIIAVPAYVGYRIIGAVLPRIIERFITIRGRGRVYKERIAKRSKTLSNVLTATIGVIIAIVASFMVLSEIGINITPLLAGAGIIGVAVGFGAQSMIRDMIAGFFIIIEGQYDVGDVIKVNNNIAGGVEGLNLRRTMLRDLDGILHIIPNGEIKMASNLTKKWSRVHLNISVAYKEDLDRVMAIIKKIWEELAEDPDWAPFLISKTPWLLRVNEFGDSGIVIKVVGETKPGKHWDTMGELRRRIKKVFDDEGIEIPWPHVKLYMGDTEAGKGQTCKACSHTNLPGSRFCSKCGAGLGSK
ncbi:MAG: mechanosensitive ion channel [Dehalococcoidales bacterium]|nr:mechanosensitive ion channel [Dehalococcoidales bacterium]